MLCARSLAEENSICLALHHGMVHSIPIGGWSKIRGVLDLYIYIFIWSSIYCWYFVHIFVVFQKTGDGMNRLPNSILVYICTYYIYIYLVLHLPFISHQYPLKKNECPWWRWHHRGAASAEARSAVRGLANRCGLIKNKHRRGMALQNLNYIYTILYN